MHSLISANSCECVSVEIRGWLLGVILTLHHGFWAIRLRLLGLQNKQLPSNPSLRPRKSRFPFSTIVSDTMRSPYYKYLLLKSMEKKLTKNELVLGPGGLS